MTVPRRRTSSRRTSAGVRHTGVPTSTIAWCSSGFSAEDRANTNALLESSEFGALRVGDAAGTWGLNAWFTIGSDGQTVMMGGFQ